MPSTATVSTKAHNTGLSVVIPFRNEEGTLAAMVHEQLEALGQAQCPFEVILVDDGSTDRSATVAESMARQTPSVRLLTHAVNLGIAGGLLTGARAASFDCVLLIPVDNPLDGETLLAFLRAGEQADVVSGWRGHRPDYGPFRRALSGVYARAANILLGLSLKDPTWICLYRRSIFDGFRQRFTRITGLPELLQHAARRGARFNEVPCPARCRAAGRSTATRPFVVLKTGIQTLALAGLVLPYRLRTALAHSSGSRWKEQQPR